MRVWLFEAVRLLELLVIVFGVNLCKVHHGQEVHITEEGFIEFLEFTV